MGVGMCASDDDDDQMMMMMMMVVHLCDLGADQEGTVLRGNQTREGVADPVL